MFTTEELEAVVVGLALLDRTRDDGLRQAAARVRQKLADVVPPQVGAIDEVPLRTSSWSDIPPSDTDCGLVRRAIREECKLRFDYRSVSAQSTTRTVMAADAHILDRRYRARRMVRVARGLSAFPGRPHEFVCLQRRPLCWRGTAAPAGLGELRRGLRRDSAPIAGIAKVHPSRRMPASPASSSSKAIKISAPRRSAPMVRSRSRINSARASTLASRPWRPTILATRQRPIPTSA